MDVEEAIRSRRTLKAYTDEPVGRELVSELLDLAVLAPNHHETEPWRFWVVGRETLEALTEATGDRKLLRSHTAIVVGVKRDHDAQVGRGGLRRGRLRDPEPHAGRARARASRASGARPACSRGPRSRSILDVPKKVRLIGVVHLGLARRAVPAAARAQRRRSSRTGCD